MNLKRNLLSAAVLSTLAVGTANAVHLSETGTGEVLLFPYYTVRSVDNNAFNTYIHITNTTNLPKAVKVRFREAKNSREVLDFNLYLSANDMWVGVIEPTADGAKISTPDKSCTAPAIPSTGEAFRNFRYTNTSLGNQADGAGTTLERTREGYVEVIEMGVPTSVGIGNTSGGAPAFNAAITHTNGVPANCPAVVNAWLGTDNLGTGSIFATLTTELSAPTGGLAGSSVLINVANGTAFENEPVVLEDFWQLNVSLATPTHAYPGTESPTLGDALAVSNVYGGGGSVITSTWAAGVNSPIDAVSAVLMRDAVINEFSVNPNVGAKTDWIVTMPTKRNYVAVVSSQNDLAGRPFTKNFVNNGTGACEELDINYFDREERAFPTAPGGGIDFSPQLPGEVAGVPTLCWEANVVTFKQFGTTGTYVGVLGSGVQRDIELESGVPATPGAGWMNMAFASVNAANDGAGTTLVDDSGVSYYGLPVIGYSVKSISNGNVSGVLSNYGTSMAHKYTRDIVVPN